MHKYMYHIGDFIRDTMHLDPLEECFYRRALDFYYLNEKPLPKETQVVFRRLRAKTQEERDAIISILSDFFIELDDGFHNKRCDDEIAKYQANGEKNRENGKLGGRPRKNNDLENPKKTQVVFDKKPIESETKGNQEPITNNQYIQDKPEKFVFKKALFDFGADANLIDEWLIVRKNKKASNTETAFNGLLSQVDKSGLDVNTVLKICIDNSWSGFKSSWIQNINISDYITTKQEAKKPSVEIKEGEMLW